ncbi:MAG: DNA primase [Candidatus Sungbacteria bacterium]|uniref:DNA primase n=1 Tax=Candidatus Sungiibacteriota bacterium TaxID=2750080 RepID=A0A931SB69_9BACT|nr:DNA primase [Candidatus Sungbacteria bacterium]
MSDPVIQEIKSRLDIVPFVQGYVKLQRAGVNWKGLCPFHSEKTPSFIVSPSRQTWHCFGCSKGGDVFKFLMEVENLEFRDALKALAERAGVELRREDPRVRTERERMYAIMETAAKFFEAEIKKTPAVIDYLTRRGVKLETIEEFRIGYAQDSWDGLSNFLRERGFSAAEFVASGLGIKSDKRADSYYDRFRNRIIFPIADASGKVIGFSGRIFERGSAPAGTEPKYVNSPQTLIYDKSRSLYAFDKAKDAIRKNNRCVVVEGQMDVVLSHQAGIKEAVAVSGTALTAKHLEQIHRLTDTLIASFDADEAGETATRRSLDLAAEHDFNRKVAIIPKGKDPADAVLENPETWKEAVEKSVALMDFYFTRALKKFSLKTAESKKDFSRYLLPEIAKIGNQIEQAHWVSKMSELLGVKEEAVWAELARYRRAVDQPVAFSVESHGPEKQKAQKLEERILAAYLLYPEARELYRGHDRSLLFAVSPHGEIFEILEREKPTEGIPGFLERVPEEWRGYLDRLIFEVEALFQNVPDAEAEIAACIREVERERLKERLIMLAESISQAEKAEDPGRLQELLKDFKAATELLGRI